MDGSAASYTLDELATALGVTPRRVRSWLVARLIPKPPFRGTGTRYGAEQLRIGRAVVALRARFPTAAALRRELATLTPAAIDALIEPLVPKPPVSLAARPAPAAADYAHERWRRVVLVPGLLELMVRDDAPLGLQRMAQDVVAHYGAVR